MESRRFRPSRYPANEIKWVGHVPEDYMTDIAVHEMDEPQPPAKRAGGAFLRGLHFGLALGGVALVIVTFLPLLHPFWPLASVAEHFALQVLMGAVALGTIAILLRRWRWLGVVGGVAFIQLWTIHPYWPSFVTGFVTGHKTALAGPMTPTAGEIKVISLNVHHHGRSYDAVRQYLSNSGADVIGLVEMSRIWKAELAPLETVYPYRVDCIDADEVCEEMLLSKYPFQRSGAARVGGAMPVLAWGEILPPGGGKPLTVAVSHVAWPLMNAAPAGLAGNAFRASLPHGLPRLTQAEQIENLTGGLRALGPNLVLMGDFNAAPWSRIQQYLRQQSGLDNQDFLVASWPAWGPAIIRLPIDHIMTRGTPRLVSFGAGPDVGSDHLPVEATLALTTQ